ncbi:MAG TPA: hypothetical protein VN838_08925 [Bradyrhizobium sp.]|nr:hypothetical protein [Bradyrhizobium sp.]
MIELLGTFDLEAQPDGRIVVERLQPMHDLLDLLQEPRSLAGIELLLTARTGRRNPEALGRSKRDGGSAFRTLQAKSPDIGYAKHDELFKRHVVRVALRWESVKMATVAYELKVIRETVLSIRARVDIIERVLRKMNPEAYAAAFRDAETTPPDAAGEDPAQ